jgi:methyl-accepting chemotaxis protein
VKNRTNTPTVKFPGMRRRDDVPSSELPGTNRRNDIPANTIPGSSRAAITVEWVGRLAAVAAIILFTLVMVTIHRGKVVQHSAKAVVHDFHVANDFFSHRANFQAPAVAKQELQQLATVLTQLNGTTAADVHELAGTLPDVRRLAAAGSGDVAIAKRMRSMGHDLQGGADDLRTVAVNANSVVGMIDDNMDQAVDAVGQLNDQLARTERKIAVVPDLSGLANSEQQRSAALRDSQDGPNSPTLDTNRLISLLTGGATP